MKTRIVAATFAMLFAVTPTLAQTAAPASGSNKPETGCTPSAAASGGGQTASDSGQTTGSTGNSMAIEKNAILPSAGGHAQSAAPTVQNNGEPMQVRPDCPPDQTKPK
jgi:hypothetical protein